MADTKHVLHTPAPAKVGQTYKVLLGILDQTLAQGLKNLNQVIKHTVENNDKWYLSSKSVT